MSANPTAKTNQDKVKVVPMKQTPKKAKATPASVAKATAKLTTTVSAVGKAKSKA